jgi:hypothetical protein
MGVALITEFGTFIVGSLVLPREGYQAPGKVVAVHSRHPRYAELSRDKNPETLEELYNKPFLAVLWDDDDDTFLVNPNEVKLA